MTTEADTIGWAVREADGQINMKTASDTKTASMVNWLWTTPRIVVPRGFTDEQVQKLFSKVPGDHRLVKVSVIEIDA